MQNHLWLYPNLVAARKAVCTQKELSEKIGISQQEISRYERGEVKAPINYLRDVADACHVSVDYILGLSPITADMLSKEEEKMLLLFRLLSENNRIRVMERANTLLEIQSEEVQT